MVKMNQKGWLLIVEAVIAVLIIFGFVFAAIAKQSQEVKTLQQPLSLYNAANLLVQKAQENETIRNYVLENDETKVNDSLKDEVNKTRLNVEINVKICNVGDICSMTLPQKEIYTGEAVITNGRESKKIKVFVWQK